MHKLVILIEPLADDVVMDERWPEFLHLAEQMPGLLREANSRVEDVLYGKHRCTLIHELFFESAAALYAAMRSPSGEAAGRLLQQITEGRMTLLVAEHKEDQIENIRKYRPDSSSATQVETMALHTPTGEG